VEVTMNRRTTARAKVDLLVNRFVDGQPYMCRATDLSATGLRLVPLLGPKRAQRFVGLQFQLPHSGALVTASAEVVNGVGTGDGEGVRFTRIAPESERALLQFLTVA
jgi:c-di-GMP-binding flagellar brake protein YcgR